MDVKEIKGNFTDVLVISELRGSFPNVAIAADIDYAQLIAGDAEPMFLTIPIGKAGVTSGNGRYYDEAWMQELERQVIANKPIGLMGHLSPDERAWAFPDEAIHWVGVAREQDSGLLWGKGYVPPGAARDRIRRYKAQGKSIATSIACGPKTEGVWDESLKAYRMKASSMQLEQIDIAPADRAGIPMLASVPIITREMEPEPESEPVIEQEPEMDKLQVINEMTPEDARLLPKPVREAILADVPAAVEVALMQSIREMLGLDAKADVTKVINEMRQAEEARKKDAVRQRITELAGDAEKGIKVESVRDLVVELVQARNPQTVQEAETAYQQVVEMASVKAALQAQVQTIMGPKQGTPVAPQQGQYKYFPELAKKQEVN